MQNMKDRRVTQQKRKLNAKSHVLSAKVIHYYYNFIIIIIILIILILFLLLLFLLLLLLSLLSILFD